MTTFGFASAERERETNPELLTEAFVDYKGCIATLLNGPNFLVLGYKGSGKSAIGQHIKLKYDDKQEHSITDIFLQDFPYTLFSKIIKGNIEPEARYPESWAFLLLLAIASSISNDESLRHPDAAKLQSALKYLRGMGLLVNGNLKDIVNIASKKSFRFKLPFDFGEAAFDAGESDVTNLSALSSLKTILFSCRSDMKHYIIIDGLDDILTKRDVQYASVGSLIFEASRLNQEFRSQNAPFKIVILCRTDVYDRISGPNKNKIRQDYGVQLLWYDNTREPEDSELYDLVLKRSKQVFGKGVDIFKSYLAPVYGTNTPLKMILDNTRYNPRDIIQVLNYIFENHKGQRISKEKFMNGLRNYSLNYFHSEIIDELSGQINGDYGAKILALISEYGRREFQFKDFIAFARSKQHADDNIEQAFRLLYDCGAISLTWMDAHTKKYSSKYRSPLTEFSTNKGIYLHIALLKSMNLL